MISGLWKARISVFATDVLCFDVFAGKCAECYSSCTSRITGHESTIWVCLKIGQIHWWIIMFSREMAQIGRYRTFEGTPRQVRPAKWHSCSLYRTIPEVQSGPGIAGAWTTQGCWMGCWGLLGLSWKYVYYMDHSRKFPTFSQHQ